MPKSKKRVAAKKRRAGATYSKEDATTRTTRAVNQRRKSPDEAVAPSSPAPTNHSTPTTTTMGPCSDKVTRMVSSLRELVASHVSSHPECAKYAPAISKYMRNKFVFLGLKAPARRALQKQFLAESGGAGSELKDRETLVEFVQSLWAQEERDFQGIGVDLLAQYRETLLGASDQDFREAVGLVEHCVVTKSWWDTVDAISYPVFGYLVRQRPSLGVPIVWQWIDHDNMWLRRVAILHQLTEKERTDEELLFKLCLRRAEETEFFIRKAIGWALRDYARTNKKGVKEFVEKNRDTFSTLSIKEALKHC